MAPNRPKVGIAIFVSSVEHPGCVLLGKRKGSQALGDGKYAPPSGHLEYSESFEECAKREVYEETNLVLKDVTYEKTINVIVPTENYHYVAIIMKGDVDLQYSSEPQNTEPDKCYGWAWYNWDDLPQNEELFQPLNILRSTGYCPF